MLPDIPSFVFSLSFSLSLFLFIDFHSPSLSLFHSLFLCSFGGWMGKRLLISMWCLCEHNPSVLKQGDLASGFPFCISPRPWKFCVSGTTPYWVPKFKNLHKAQEWSVHSCQLYTHVVLLDEKKTLLRNHYCLGGSDLCCFDHRFVVPRSCINETVLMCLKCVHQTVLHVELGRI